MLKQIKNRSVILKTNSNSGCDSFLMAISLGIQVNENLENKTVCKKEKFLDNCLNEVNLKYNCSIDPAEFAQSTTGIINSQRVLVYSIKSSVKKCNLDGVCLESSYFQIYCSNKNSKNLNLVLKIKEKNLKYNLSEPVEKNSQILKYFLIIEKENGSRGYYHLETGTYFIIIKEQNAFRSMMVRATNYFYNKSSGYLVKGCEENFDTPDQANNICSNLDTDDQFSNCLSSFQNKEFNSLNNLLKKFTISNNFIENFKNKEFNIYYTFIENTKPTKSDANFKSKDLYFCIFTIFFLIFVKRFF